MELDDEQLPPFEIVFIIITITIIIIIIIIVVIVIILKFFSKVATVKITDQILFVTFC